jgi:glucose/arabinose dehydrogenase
MHHLMRILSRLLVIGSFAWLPVAAQAQPSVELKPFASGFTNIADIAHPPGDERLFVLQQNGIIRIVDAEGNVADQNFLDISDQITTSGSEQGLLGLAFHPDFADNGRFFVNYTGNASVAEAEGNTIVAEFSTLPNNPAQADPDSEQQLLEISQPFANHNGGDLRFGPEGYLYISTGDGGSGGDPQNNAQDGSNLLGKMLRLDVDKGDPYAIPDENPFVNKEQVRDEVYALGLRNPWRTSFDRYTGDLWIADVGQNQIEEVNREAAPLEGGQNYGWRCYEGSQPFNTDGCDERSVYQLPVFDYEHASGSCGSVTGGYVYRGARYNALFGQYLAADYCTGTLYAVEETDQGFTHSELGDFANFEYTTFGQNQYGELFLGAAQEGVVYRITETSDCQPVAEIKGPNRQGLNEATEKTLSTFYHPSLTYQWSRNGEPVANADTHQLTVQDTGRYTVEVTNPENGCANTDQVQLAESVTNVANQNSKGDKPQVYPNPAREAFTVQHLPEGEGPVQLTLYSSSGQVVKRLTAKGDGPVTLRTTELTPGMYALTIRHQGTHTVRKVRIQ